MERYPDPRPQCVGRGRYTGGFARCLTAIWPGSRPGVEESAKRPRVRTGTDPLMSTSPVMVTSGANPVVGEFRAHLCSAPWSIAAQAPLHPQGVVALTPQLNHRFSSSPSRSPMSDLRANVQFRGATALLAEAAEVMQ